VGIDELIQRILFFDAVPVVHALDPVTVGGTGEEMLELALQSEKQAVAQFNASADECHRLGDHGTASLFERMVLEEEGHADWFDSQLAAVERVGAAAYLAQQLEPGQGPAS